MGTAAELVATSYAPVVRQVPREDYELIHATVAKGSTDAEFRLLVHMANNYGLDPLLKEIWCVKRNQNDPALIMCSRDGYLKVAQDHPDYEGLLSFVVREGDEFSIDASEYSITHRMGAKRGAILGAWARCDRRGRRPQICFVDFEEYKGNSPVWSKYPSAMIQKVAEVFVLKRQFTINGLVTKEELDAGEVPSPPVIDAQYSIAAPEPSPKMACETCGAELTQGQANYSQTAYHKSLCPKHQKSAAAAQVKTAGRAAEAPAPEPVVSSSDPSARITASTLATLTKKVDAWKALGADDVAVASLMSKYGSATPEHLTELRALDLIDALQAQIDNPDPFVNE
ncbi:MAG TPA: RecT family recombinase [Armatimonadota bacterium]|jgi:phage recombination protein Bet